MAKKILITGPESTGKSSLVKSLAYFFQATYVEEYAREYIKLIKRDYIEEDLLEIAKGQIQREYKALKKTEKLVFFDTDLTVIDIWSREKYGKTHPWILEEMRKRAYDLYLIPDIDLEWTFDPQRENPNDRDRLIKLYQQSFEIRNIPYHMVRGQGEERTQNAIELIRRELNIK